jgi:hypothetical protein
MDIAFEIEKPKVRNLIRRKINLKKRCKIRYPE